MPPRFPSTRLASLAGAALLSLGLAACGSSSPAAHQSAGPSTSTSTSTTTTSAPHASTTATIAGASTANAFSPFTPQGGMAQGLEVTQKVSGHCTSPGVAGGASYRCTAQPGGMTYDPCFAAPMAAKGPLLCDPYPTDMDVTQFTVGALPGTSRTPPRVWAMQLGNGQVCILVRATWKGLGPFACPTPSAAAVADCRTPHATADGWATACQATQDAASPFDTRPVTTVWN